MREPITFRVYWTDEYGTVQSAEDAHRDDLSGAITYAANRLKASRGLARNARGFFVRAVNSTGAPVETVR